MYTTALCLTGALMDGLVDEYYRADVQNKSRQSSIELLSEWFSPSCCVGRRRFFLKLETGLLCLFQK